MSLSKNSISPKSITTTPIKLKYNATYTSSWDGYATGDTFLSVSISVNGAKNGDVSSQNITGSQSIFYRAIKHLYYEQYLTGSVNNSASCWDWNAQSTACSGSSEYEYRYIPTGSGDLIAIINISPQIFGEQISRTTFNLRPIIGDEYNIIDDGNGNLIDIQNSNNIHVGNIIYSQGLAIITNPEYSPGFIVPNTVPDPYYTPTASISTPYNQSYVETSATSEYVEFTL
jgi:hypothetical protein